VVSIVWNAGLKAGSTDWLAGTGWPHRKSAIPSTIAIMDLWLADLFIGKSP